MNPQEPQQDPLPRRQATSQSVWAGSRRSVMIARMVGILCVAGGFMLGIQGLGDQDSFMLPTALGMIVAGFLAQVFVLVRTCVGTLQGKR